MAKRPENNGDLDETDERYAEVMLTLEVLDRLNVIADRDPCYATDAAQELEHGLVKKLAAQFGVKLPPND